MANIRIRGRTLDVDIRAELEKYTFLQADWSDQSKLIAASPFRYDKSPSFYVYLDDTASARAGYWGDSGYYDAEWAKGSFTKLIAFLRNETEDESVDYLMETYSLTDRGNDLQLNIPKLCGKSLNKNLDYSILGNYKYRHPYLSKRGISEKIQLLNNIGYDRTRQAVVLPWFTAEGRLANIKYRKTHGKAFWYERGGVPIRDLLYGINIIYSRRCKKAVICEAEIDAMSIMEAGVAAIAVGGSSFNDKKRDIILRSSIEELIVMTDNDKAGKKLRDQIEELLRGRIDMRIAEVAPGYKDANEMLIGGGASAIRKAVAESEDVRVFTY